MVKLTFYGGVSTIGGNCVVLEEDGHRIMIDNGKCFSAEGSFYKEFLNPRKNNDIRDYLALGLIPPINGIYGKELINDVCIDKVPPGSEFLFSSELQSYEDYLAEHGTPFIDAILISHAHLDHIRNLLFMDPEIPVYCSQITYDLFKIISDLSDDYLNYTHSKISELKKGYFPGELRKTKTTVARNFIILEPNNPHEIGVFEVTGFPTDHSIPGGMAFKIRTSAGKQIVYTGDIRFHGHPQDRNNSHHFVDTIRLSTTDALITEGTRIDDEDNKSEDDVFHQTVNRIQREDALASKLILVSFPWKNLSRFQTTYKIARELKRTFVIQPKLAYLLHNLGARNSLGINRILQNDDLRIYLPRQSSMTYSWGDYVYAKDNISYNIKWDKANGKKYLYRDIYGEQKHITAYELQRNPERFLLHLEFYNINQLIDIRPPENSIFFNMKTEPFDEEGMIEQQILENWMQRFKLNLIRIHASGHAPGSQLLDMVVKINPKVIFPIHTEKPELFTMKNAIIPIILGKEYEI
ncbi:MAG: MBL fold metallo-hydrolase [Candidatus Helarchaeota archaeon]